MQKELPDFAESNEGFALTNFVYMRGLLVRLQLLD